MEKKIPTITNIWLKFQGETLYTTIIAIKKFFSSAYPYRLCSHVKKQTQFE